MGQPAKKLQGLLAVVLPFLGSGKAEQGVASVGVEFERTVVEAPAAGRQVALFRFEAETAEEKCGQSPDSFGLAVIDVGANQAIEQDAAMGQKREYPPLAVSQVGLVMQVDERHQAFRFPAAEFGGDPHFGVLQDGHGFGGVAFEDAGLDLEQAGDVDGPRLPGQASDQLAVAVGHVPHPHPQRLRTTVAARRLARPATFGRHILGCRNGLRQTPAQVRPQQLAVAGFVDNQQYVAWGRAAFALAHHQGIPPGRQGGRHQLEHLKRVARGRGRTFVFRQVQVDTCEQLFAREKFSLAGGARGRQQVGGQEKALRQPDGQTGSAAGTMARPPYSSG